MRANTKIIASIPFLFTFFLLECASTRAPSGWLPTTGEAQKEAYGAWISLEHNNGSSNRVAEGEFIAVSSDYVFVLTKDSLVVIPLDKIKSGRLATYNSQHGLLVLWTFGGLLSTPSHGWFAILSLPVWIGSGIIASTAQSFAPIEKYPAHSWDDLRKFARFPQGLPEGVDPKTLKRK